MIPQKSGKKKLHTAVMIITEWTILLSTEKSMHIYIWNILQETKTN